MTQTLTDDEITLLALKGAIAELGPEAAAACVKLITQIKQLMAEAGTPIGQYAVAYIGAELQMEAK